MSTKNDETLIDIGLVSPKVWRPIQTGGLSTYTANHGITDVLQTPVVLQEATPTSTTSGTAPLQVTSVAATESGYKTKDGTMLSLVSVSFSVNPTDRNFGSVQIFFSGYNGNANPQLVNGGNISPVSFLVPTTNETVTVTVVAMSPDGVTADFASAPTTTVTLDGVTSAPPPPSIAEFQISTPVGYQFAFNVLSGIIADQIDGYRIYHSTTNTLSDAVPISYVKHAVNDSGVFVFQETVGAGTQYWYWVTSVNTSQLESTPTAAFQNSTVQPVPPTPVQPDPNLLQNNSFENGATNWSAASANVQYLTTPTQAFVGNGCLRLTCATGAQTLSWQTDDNGNFASYPVIPGHQLYLGGTIFLESGGGTVGVHGENTVNVVVEWRDATMNVVTPYFNGPFVTTTGSWKTTGTYATVPNTARYARFFCQIFNPTSTTVARFDKVFLQYVQQSAGVSYPNGVTIDTLQPAEPGAETTTGKAIGVLADDSTFFRPRTYSIANSSDSPYNGSFEVFPDSQTVADGWTANFETTGTGATYSRSVIPFTGTYAQNITASLTGGGSVASRAVPVQGGVMYQLSGRAKSDVATTTGCFIRVLWYSDDVDLTRTGTSLISLSDAAAGIALTTSYQSFSGTFVAPSNATFARVALYCWAPNVTATYSFDTVTLVQNLMTGLGRVTGSVTQDSFENRIWNNWCQGTAGTTVGVADSQPPTPIGTVPLASAAPATPATFTGDGRIYLAPNGAGNTSWVYTETLWQYAALPGDPISVACQVQWADNSLPNPNGQLVIVVYGVTSSDVQTGSSVSLYQNLNVANAVGWSTYSATFHLPSDAVNVYAWRFSFGVYNESAKGIYMRRLQANRSAELPRWSSFVPTQPSSQVPSGGVTSPGTMGGGSGTGGGGYDPSPTSTCFTAPVRIKTPHGFVAFEHLPIDRPFVIENETGVHQATLVVHENTTQQMIDLGGDGTKLVTLGHHMKDNGLWIPACEKYPHRKRVGFQGTVYNLHVLTDNEADRHYILENGDVAHNVIKPNLNQ